MEFYESSVFYEEQGESSNTLINLEDATNHMNEFMALFVGSPIRAMKNIDVHEVDIQSIITFTVDFK